MAREHSLDYGNVHLANAQPLKLDTARSCGASPRCPAGASRVDSDWLNLSEEAAEVVRCLFSSQSLGRQPSGRSVVTKSAGVQALCFGDFHLGLQMKVTRLSGRDPTRCDAEKPSFAEAENQRPIAKTIKCES